jgi:hypothetical protein
VDADGNISVEPGVAVDGYGRELVLSERKFLLLSAFSNKGSDILDVFLVYDRVEGDLVPRGYAGCGPDGQGPFSRWVERPRIRLEVPDPSFPDPRRPGSVPPDDWDFPPSRTPPDDPVQDWPVFLGEVTRDRSNPDRPVYTVDLEGRPYAGLVGDRVQAPSSRARVQLGPRAAGDDLRFGVFVPEADPGPNAKPRIAIDVNGDLRIRGDTKVEGDVTADRTAVEFQAGTARPANAPPWRIYHLEDAAAGTHELRIEMARPPAGGTPGANEVVIGTWAQPEGGQPGFQPCLTVGDDCSVTVRGNLVVQGRITGVGGVSGRLSSQAEAFIGAALLSGMGGASSLVDRFYRSPYGGRSAGEVEFAAMAMTASGVSGAPTGPGEMVRLTAMARNLAGDPDRTEAFAELLRSEHPELAQRLGRALGSRLE